MSGRLIRWCWKFIKPCRPLLADLGCALIQVTAYLAGRDRGGSSGWTAIVAYIIGRGLVALAGSVADRGSVPAAVGLAAGDGGYRDPSAGLHDRIAELQRENNGLRGKQPFSLEAAFIGAVVGLLFLLVIVVVSTLISGWSAPAPDAGVR